MSNIEFTEKSILAKNAVSLVYLSISNGNSSRPNGEKYYLPIYPLLSGSGNYFISYLNSKPGINETSIRKYVERGALYLQLSYAIPDYLANNFQRFLTLGTTLSLISKNEDEEKILKKIEFTGNTAFFSIELTPGLCDKIFDALQNKSTDLYVKSKLKCAFPSSGTLKKIESYISLRKLFNTLIISNENDSGIKIKYKYFDMSNEGYTDLPLRYQIDTAKKGLTFQNVSFLNNDYLASSLLAIAPSAFFYLPPWQLNYASTYNAKTNLYIIDNWEINIKPGQEVFDYPVINDDSSEYWSNKKNEQEYLAIPEFTIVAPQLNEDVQTSPFSFIFHNLGTFDKDGRPVLEGEIKVCINKKITDSLIGSINESNPGKTVRAINIGAVNYTLIIPYGANEEMKITTQEIKSLNDETTQLTFRLGNEAVRLCYATISANNTNEAAKKAQLSLYAYFYGYTLIPANHIDFANIIGAKISSIPILTASLNTKGLAKLSNTYFDATQNKLVKENGEEIVFKDISAKDKPAKTKDIGFMMKPVNTIFEQNTIPPVINLPLAEDFPSTIKDENYKLQAFARSISLDFNFPCDQYGNFYQEKDNDGNLFAVGCREAYRLGEAPDTLYAEIEEMANTKYKVYRSRAQPNNFLIVPATYIIARYSQSTDAKKRYKPCIYLYSTIDVVGNTSSWLLDFTLVPDISLSGRIELEHELKNYTPYHPESYYITEIEHKEAHAILSGISAMPGVNISAFPMGKEILISIQTSIESILILLATLRNNTIEGVFQFTQTDDVQQTVNLKPKLNNIAGTWETGHFEFTKNTSTLSLKNISESTVSLEKLKFYHSSDDAYEEKNIIQELLPNGSLDVDISNIPSYSEVAPYYSIINPENITIEQINNYIEDVKCQLIFIATFDFATNNIKSIEINYRLKNSDQTFSLSLNAENNNCEEELLMPLTDFLMERVIEYKLEKIIKDDDTEINEANEWLTQDITTQGPIINITSNFIM